MAASLIALPIWSQTDEQVQWEAYKKIIPSYDHISLSFEGGELRGDGSYNGSLWISGNYSVSFTGKIRRYWQNDKWDEDVTANFNANGLVKWDSETKKILVTLRGTASGQSEYRDLSNGIRTTKRNGSNSIDKTFVLFYDKNSKTFRIEDGVSLEAQTGRSSIYMKLRYAKCNFGNKRAEVTNADQFGQWKWNSDRSVIYLKSNMSDSQLQIIRSNGLQLTLKLPGNAVGISQQATDNGTTLDMFELSFDGSSPNTFSFARLGNGTFKFATYNRFTNVLSYDASSIINQIGKKQTINIDYKLSTGERRSEMFILEGLETILGYLK